MKLHYVLFITPWHEPAIKTNGGSIPHIKDADETSLATLYPGVEWIHWGTRFIDGHEIRLMHTSMPAVENTRPLAKITDYYWAIYARAFEIYLKTKEFVTISPAQGPASEIAQTEL